MMIIIYDGDCPFCRNFVEMTNIRKEFGTVELINARLKDNIHVCRVLSKGYKLNDGMAVIHNEKVYYGADAMMFLSFANRKGTFAFLMRIFFGSNVRSKILYPILVLMRKIYLRLTGFKDLDY